MTNIRRAKHFLRKADRATYSIGIVYLFWFLLDPRAFGGDPFTTDPMAPIGFVLVILGFGAALLVQSSLSKVTDDHFRAGSILAGCTGGNQVPKRVDLVDVCSRAVLVLVLGAIVLWANLVLKLGTAEGRFHLTSGSLLAVWLIASRFAAALASASLLGHLSFASLRLRLSPGHPDRLGGFGRLGILYLDQALLLLVPGLFMSAAWFLSSQALVWLENPPPAPLPFGIDRENLIDMLLTGEDEGDPRYRFSQFHFWFTLINLIVFLGASVVPMLILSRAMARAKRRDLAEPTAQIAAELAALRDQLDATDVAQASALRERASKLAALHDAYAYCPTFPLSVRNFVIAAVSNISAVLGILSLIL